MHGAVCLVIVSEIKVKECIVIESGVELVQYGLFRVRCRDVKSQCESAHLVGGQVIAGGIFAVSVRGVCGNVKRDVYMSAGIRCAAVSRR